jgi:hypothetical protein
LIVKAPHWAERVPSGRALPKRATVCVGFFFFWERTSLDHLNIYMVTQRLQMFAGLEALFEFTGQTFEQRDKETINVRK